jgi:hypothetical protein
MVTIIFCNIKFLSLHNQTSKTWCLKIPKLYIISGSEDDITCDDGVRCNYLRDVSGLQSHLNSHYHNTDLSLAQMLTDFFQFYSNEFDFSRDAACIITGDIQVKIALIHLRSAMYRCPYFKK